MSDLNCLIDAMQWATSMTSVVVIQNYDNFCLKVTRFKGIFVFFRMKEWRLVGLCTLSQIFSMYISHGQSLLTCLTWLIHTSFLPSKMESVSINTIFGLKMMVTSGLEKIFLKFFQAGDYFPLLHKSAQNHKFSMW